MMRERERFRASGAGYGLMIEWELMRDSNGVSAQEGLDNTCVINIECALNLVLHSPHLCGP